MRSLGSARGDEVGSVERAVLRLRAAGGDQALVALQDMDLVPLLIQENYLNHRPAQAGSEVQQMQVCLPGNSQKLLVVISGTMAHSRVLLRPGRYSAPSALGHSHQIARLIYSAARHTCEGPLWPGMAALRHGPPCRAALGVQRDICLDLMI